MRFVLCAGADVNTPHGTLLPLQCACMIGDVVTAELLLKHGALVRIFPLLAFPRNLVIVFTIRDVRVFAERDH